MSSTINDRAMLLLAHLCSLGDAPGRAGRSFWERFGAGTGIAAQRWRSVLARRQKATLEMLEVLTTKHPEYAFWLMTGITDTANGHIAPPNAVTFPERTQVDDYWGRLYFKHSLRLLARIYEESGIDLNDDTARLEASTRVRELARYTGGPMVDTAYRLASSEEYAEALELWNNRERDRPQHLGRLTGTNLPAPEQEKSSESGGHPILGGDGRGWHQSPWDMFFKPVPKKKSGKK